MFAGLTEMIARTVMGLFVIPVYGFTAACFTDQAAWIAATVYITVDFFIIMKKERKKYYGQRPEQHRKAEYY